MKNNTPYKFTMGNKNETKGSHTPGPWKAEGWEDSIVNDSNGNTLAAMPGACYGRDVMRSTAALIASAPDLLKENKELKARIEELEIEIKVLQQFDER